MQIRIELTEGDLKRLIMQKLADMLPDENIIEKDVSIEVKSKQNFKSEWEKASFRAIVEKG